VESCEYGLGQELGELLERLVDGVRAVARPVLNRLGRVVRVHQLLKGSVRDHHHGCLLVAVGLDEVQGGLVGADVDNGVVAVVELQVALGECGVRAGALYARWLAEHEELHGECLSMNSRFRRASECRDSVES